MDLGFRVLGIRLTVGWVEYPTPMKLLTLDFVVSKTPKVATLSPKP